MNVSSLLSGKSRSRDRKVVADELVQESDVTDAPKLARLLTRMLRDISALRRRFAPQQTDFEDVVLGSGTTHRFPHWFGGRVRWWVVDAPNGYPVLRRDDAATDANTLVLLSSAACTATIRVEEAG